MNERVSFTHGGSKVQCAAIAPLVPGPGFVFTPGVVQPVIQCMREDGHAGPHVAPYTWEMLIDEEAIAQDLRDLQ